MEGLPIRLICAVLAVVFGALMVMRRRRNPD